MHDKDRLFDKEKRSFAITHNLKGNSIEEWDQQYKINEQFRQRKRSDSVLLTHEILSWHREDAKHITLAKMEEMAREYINKRNPNGMYVAVPHFDKEHYHIHICASGIEYRTGKSLRLPKADLLKLKKEIQEFQIERFPELSKSVVAHGKKGKSLTSEKEYQIKLRTGRETNKEQVMGILNTCYKKADSREIFFKLLKGCNVETYERNGEVNGVLFQNYKFRFNKLGFNEDRMKELDKCKRREGEIRESRNEKEGVELER